MKIQRYLEKKFSDNRNFVKKLKKNFRKFGINLEHWERYPTYKQIKLDIASKDETALYEMLKSVDRTQLVAYLPEHQWHRFTAVK